MSLHIHGWIVFVEYFWRSLWRHRKRGNRHMPPVGIVKSLRMASCARAVILGPPYRLRWMDRWEERSRRAN
jgi:hypothetical protein